MTIPEQAVQAETLWAVNIQGPDDLIAAPDYLSAVRMSNAFNAWWLNLKMKQPHNDAIDARMWAAPADWPEKDAQAHADELSKPHPEYQWLRDASAFPHLAAVRVKKIGYVSAVELYTLQQIETCVDLFTVAQSGPMKFVPVYAAADQVFGNSEQLNSSIDNGLPASEKTVKRRVADALENVWTALDCDVDQIERVIAHMRENGLRIVETVKIDNAEVILEPSAGRAAVLEEAAIFEALEECETYFENRSDADHDETGFVPNEEMRILVSVRAAIRALASHPVEDKPDEAGAQGGGWLPIDHPDTPRDGTEILAWRKDCGQFIASYTSCSAFPMSEAELDLLDEETLFKEDWFTQWPQALRLEGSEVPTRWRHLPTPPSGEVA